MLDISTISAISAIVASIGVLVGVVFAYLEVRSLVRTRKTELLHGIFSTLNRREFAETWEKFRDRESLDFEDYKKKYGLVEWNIIVSAFTEIGFLLSEKLIDIDAVHKIFGRAIRIAWEKTKLLVEDIRKRDPQEVWAFEYLYNEMKKREQSLQQIQEVQQ